MKALKIGFAFAAAMLASVGVGQAQQVVRVSYAPFGASLASLPGATPENYKSLDPSKAFGATIDLVNAIAKDAGFQVQFIPVASGDVEASFSSKSVDIRTYSTITPNNAAFMTFSDPVFNNSDVLYVKKGDNKEYKEWEDLKGEVVGTQAGTFMADPVQKSGLFKEVKVVASGGGLGQQLIVDGQVKAFFGDNMLAGIDQVRAGAGPYAGVQIAQSYRPRYLTANAIGVDKNNDDLLKKVNTSLARLKADGTIKAIFAKYGLETALVK